MARSRARRMGIALIFAVALMLIAAWIAIQVIVSTQTLRRWINTSPDELALDYESASAWIPGTLRLHGLTMRGSDRNVQWSFRMEDAAISVSLLDLLHKEFHATHVRATGLVFHLRERWAKNQMTAAHSARTPEIAGFSGPPLPIDTPEPPPPSEKEARHRYWSVHIENLVADPVPEIWIEIYRFRGAARVTGGFYLHPHVEARIGPAAVDFQSGDLTLGSEETLLRAVTGKSECVIDPYSPDKVIGDAIWHKISGGVKLEGRIADLRFLNYFLRPAREPRLSGGTGSARLAVRFDHGMGKGGADFEAASAAAQYAAGTLQGNAAGRLEIPRWDVAEGNMDISGSRVDLSQILSAGTPRDERDWWGRFNITEGQLHRGLQAHATVSARDARPLYTLFRANLPGWAQGILKLDGLNGTAQVRVASDLVDLQNLDAAGGTFHIAGRYRQKGKDTHGAFLVENGLLTVGVAIDGDVSHVKLIGAKKWFRENSSATDQRQEPEPARARTAS